MEMLSFDQPAAFTKQITYLFSLQATHYSAAAPSSAAIFANCRSGQRLRRFCPKFVEMRVITFPRDSPSPLGLRSSPPPRSHIHAPSTQSHRAHPQLRLGWVELAQ